MDGQGNQGNAHGLAVVQPEVPGPQLPDQAQMAAAIDTLTQKIQQSGAEAEARRLTDAQRAREAGCKEMSRMPKYKGEGAFRT